MRIKLPPVARTDLISFLVAGVYLEDIRTLPMYCRQSATYQCIIACVFRKGDNIVLPLEGLYVCGDIPGRVPNEIPFSIQEHHSWDVDLLSPVRHNGVNALIVTLFTSLVHVQDRSNSIG